ncbi:MAG: ABC transporter substrate-binding protein [Deltaproteobacteria bacterium]
MVIRDNTGQASLGLQQYAELVNMKPKPLFFGVPHTPTAEALREKFKADNVIGYVPSSVDDLYPQGNAYGFYALYPEQAGILVRWVKENFKEKRNPRVAIITWDHAYGRAIMTPEFYAYCKKIGVDIVAKELFGVRDVDVTTQMVRIRAKKPDWLLTNCTGSGPVAIMRAAKELGMKTKLLNGVAGGWELLRVDPDLFQGCVSTINHVSYDADQLPSMKKLKKYMKKYKRTIKEQSLFYIIGWEYALMVHNTVKAAVAKAGGWDKLTTAAIMNELNSLTDWEPLDGIAKVTYTKKMRSSPWMCLFRIEGKKLINIVGPGKFVKAPDLRPEKFR